MKHIYGEFSREQIVLTKKSLRSSIFFLLLSVDKNTKDEYEDVDVNKCFEGILYKISGLNTLLFCPKEIVITLSLLQEAKDEYNKSNFDFKVYRKLILDAGAEIEKIKEV